MLARVQAPARASKPSRSCHPMDYIEAIRDASPAEGLVQLDADTSMSPGSFEAALHAVGGAMHAVDEVVSKKAANAFFVMRPPGHHAETRAANGLLHVQPRGHRGPLRAEPSTALSASRVVDFDVHHGNGTQDIFWADPTLMYCSTHQMPLYPGTGAATSAASTTTSSTRRCARRRRRGIPCRDGDADPAALARFRARADRHFRRLRCAHARPARQSAIRSKRISAGPPARSWRSQTRPRRVAWFRCSKAATTCKGLSRSVAAHVIALMRG